MSIVSNRDPRFMAHFWKNFQKAMGTQLMMSTTFHSQTDGQSERAIQVLEDMLRACVLDLKGSWEDSPTTIIIRQVYRWYPMRLCIGGHVDLRFVEQRWERGPSLVWI